MKRLTEHFTPQRNIEYEIYLFLQARQLPQETLDQFLHHYDNLPRPVNSRL